MNKTRTRNLMIAVAIVVIALLAAISFYAFESPAAWVQRHDEWQVVALLLLPLVLATGLALYYWRKHAQLEGEVAQRRRIEGTLRQQRNLYEGMLTAQSELGEGLVVIEDERIRYANDAFCGISGYGAEELKALPGFIELVAEAERAQILERQRRRREGEGVETHFDTALRRKDGRRVDIEVAFKVLEAEDCFRSVVIVRDVTGRKLAEARLREAEERYRTLVENISPLRTRTGEVTGMIGVTADITERERAEEALREAEELFRSVFDNAPIGITMSSLDGHYLRVNRALCDILGYSEEELLSTTFQDLT